MSSQTQTWDPKQYQARAGYVAELGKPVLELLAPRSGNRVLDLGCGDGVLSLEIARRGCDVVGIDASREMVDAARGAGVDAQVGNGAALSFEAEFDAVFSNAALHWMKPPEAVIAGVWRALKPGGRFVGEFGGSGNVATIISAIEAALSRRGIQVPNPWFFPTPQEYKRLLAKAGFKVHSIELFRRPTRLPGGVRVWLRPFPGVTCPPSASRNMTFSYRTLSQTSELV
jgi:SAM-dependent methyltransferase